MKLYQVFAPAPIYAHGHSNLFTCGKTFCTGMLARQATCITMHYWLKILAPLLQPNYQKENQSKLARTHLLMLCVSYMRLLQVLIGLLDCPSVCFLIVQSYVFGFALTPLSLIINNYLLFFIFTAKYYLTPNQC